MKEKIIVSLFSVFAIVLLMTGTFVGAMTEDIVAISAGSIVQISSGDGRFVLPENDIGIINGQFSLKIIDIKYEEGATDNEVQIDVTPYDVASEQAGVVEGLKEGGIFNGKNYVLKVVKIGETSVLFEISKVITIREPSYYDLGERFVAYPEELISVNKDLHMAILDIFYEEGVDTNGVNIIAGVSTGTSTSEYFMVEGDKINVGVYEIYLVKVGQTSAIFEVNKLLGTTPIGIARFGEKFALKPQGKASVGGKLIVELSDITYLAVDTETVGYDSASAAITLQLVYDDVYNKRAAPPQKIGISEGETVPFYGYNVKFVEADGQVGYFMVTEMEPGQTTYPANLNEYVTLGIGATATYSGQRIKISLNDIIQGCNFGEPATTQDCTLTASFIVFQTLGSDDTGAISALPLRLNKGDSVDVLGYKMYVRDLSERSATFGLFHKESSPDQYSELGDKVKLALGKKVIYREEKLEVAYAKYVPGTCYVTQQDDILESEVSDVATTVSSTGVSVETDDAEGPTTKIQATTQEPTKCGPEYAVFLITQESNNNKKMIIESPGEYEIFIEGYDAASTSNLKAFVKSNGNVKEFNLGTYRGERVYPRKSFSLGKLNVGDEVIMSVSATNHGQLFQPRYSVENDFFSVTKLTDTSWQIKADEGNSYDGGYNDVYAYLRIKTEDSVNFCFDSDIGLDYHVKGETSSSSGTKIDFCNQNRIVEYYCGINGIANREEYCSGGCDDGECLNSYGEHVDEDDILRPIDAQIPFDLFNSNDDYEEARKSTRLIVPIGDSEKIGNYAIGLLDVSPSWALFVMKDLDSIYDPKPIDEFEYVCPAGCTEIEEGCLCPKIKVRRTTEGYDIDSAEGTTNAKRIIVGPGDKTILAVTETDESVELGEGNLKEGFEISADFAGKSTNIKISTDDELWTYLEEDYVKAKTRKTVFVDSEGISVETSKGQDAVKVLPSVASEKAKEVLGDIFADIEIVDKGGEAKYETSAEKRVKVLGVIPVNAKYTVEVDAETGVVETSKPWYTAISTK